MTSFVRLFVGRIKHCLILLLSAIFSSKNAFHRNQIASRSPVMRRALHGCRQLLARGFAEVRPVLLPEDDIASYVIRYKEARHSFSSLARCLSVPEHCSQPSPTPPRATPRPAASYCLAVRSSARLLSTSSAPETQKSPISSSNGGRELAPGDEEHENTDSRTMPDQASSSSRKGNYVGSVLDDTFVLFDDSCWRGRSPHHPKARFGSRRVRRLDAHTRTFFAQIC